MIGVQTKGLAHDLIHALVGVTFDALHQAHHDRVPRNQALEFGKGHTGELGRNGHHDDFGVLDGLPAVAGGGHIAWQLFHYGKAHAVVVMVADAFHDLRLDGPHGHIVAGIGEHLPEGGAPCTGAQHGHICHY